MKQVVQYIGTSFLVLIMLVAVFTLLAPHLGWRIDTALSNSMSPTLKAGAVLVTQPVDPTDIEVGNIITYGSPIDGKVVTHRVIEVREHSPPLFQTKGDANEDPDPYAVPAENIVGRVWLYVPLLGYAVHFIKTPLGFVLLLLIPGLIIIGMEIRNIWWVLTEQQIERKIQGKVRR